MAKVLGIVLALVVLWGLFALLRSAFESVVKIFQSSSKLTGLSNGTESDKDIDDQVERFLSSNAQSHIEGDRTDDLTLEFLRSTLPEAYRPRDQESLRLWDMRPYTPERVKDIRNRARSSIQAKLEVLRSQSIARKNSEEQRWREVRQVRESEHKRDLLQEQEKATRSALELLGKNEDKVNKFFEIAYRKVATPDDYGDENPAALEIEVLRLIQKIGENESTLASAARDLKDKNKAARAKRDPLVRALMQELNNRFSEYYERRKRGGLSQNVTSMTGIEFELHVAELVRKTGVNDVSTTPTTGDHGGDLLFTSRGIKYVVQAKRHAASVGNKAVQEVHAAKGYYQCDRALVVTNSQFTPAAKTLAKELEVILVNGDQLSDLRRFIE